MAKYVYNLFDLFERVLMVLSVSTFVNLFHVLILFEDLSSNLPYFNGFQVHYQRPTKSKCVLYQTCQSISTCFNTLNRKFWYIYSLLSYFIVSEQSVYAFSLCMLFIYISTVFMVQAQFWCIWRKSLYFNIF